MTRWTVGDIPSQTGKRAVITGATGGLGFETASALARAGAQVVLLGRNDQKGRVALERIASLAPAAEVRFENVDLASLASVNACATRLIDEGRPIDLLVNNAGVMALPVRATTVDGFEAQLATNHLGHFLLTARLLAPLRRGASPRVVNVSSLMHRMGRIDFDDLQSERRYRPNAAYAQSKLANLLFTFELQRRGLVGDWGLSSLAAHPGGSNTDLMANGPGTEGFVNKLSAGFLKRVGQSAAEGALPILYASVSPNAEPGGYYGPAGLFELKGAPAPAHVAPKAEDGETARRLWEVSARLTGAVWP